MRKEIYIEGKTYILDGMTSNRIVVMTFLRSLACALPIVYFYFIFYTGLLAS
jgi:hypothetical protein